MALSTIMIAMGAYIWLNTSLPLFNRIIGFIMFFIGYMVIAIKNKEIMERINFLEDARNLVITFIQKDIDDEEES